MSFAITKFFPGFFWLAIAAGILFFAPKISVSVQAADYGYTPVYDKLTKTLDWQEKIATFSMKPKPKPVPIVPRSAVVVNSLAPSDLDAVFTQAAAAFGVNKDLLVRIAKCESNFHSNSINPAGPYLGMFQYLESTWVATRKAMGTNPDPSLVFNAVEAINTTAWKIAHGGISAWPVCAK